MQREGREKWHSKQHCTKCNDGRLFQRFPWTSRNWTILQCFNQEADGFLSIGEAQTAELLVNTRQEQWGLDFRGFPAGSLVNKDMSFCRTDHNLGNHSNHDNQNNNTTSSTTATRTTGPTTGTSITRTNTITNGTLPNATTPTAATAIRTTTA